MDDELCPLDGRRSVTGIVSKLLFVHVTAFIAYFHLLSTRKERLRSWKAVFCIISPPVLLLQYGLALAVLAIALVVAFFERDSRPYKPRLRRAGVLLFGGMIDEPDVPLIDQPHDGGKQSIEPHRRITYRIGRIFGGLFVVTQCSSSIVLFHRRQEHDAITDIDRRAFDVACGGLIAALLSIIYLVWEPQASQRDVIRDSSLAERAVMRLLDLLIKCYDGLYNVESFFYNSALALVSSLVRYWPQIMTEFAQISSSVYWETETGWIVRDNPGSVLARSFLVLYLPSWGVSHVVFAGFLGGMDVGLGRYRTLFIVVGSMLFSPLGFMPIFTLLSPFFNAYTLDEQWRGIWKDMNALQTWPVDKPCPLLWQDNKVGAFWGFA
ncbi:hypothetical protein GGR57DRAFT_424869 [Xylariaceae sp. FL1272]|nr:hypothetical protein GGR57DRAFT_424869 [Xylariaceae sp. FL1272]